MNISKYIWSILRTAPAVIMSWGLHAKTDYAKDGMTGLRFCVNGFKHKGHVAVLYNQAEDLFEIELQDGDGESQSRHCSICFDSLIQTIDDLIEKTDNYASDVRAWLEERELDPDREAAKDMGKTIRSLQELGMSGEPFIIG